MKNCKRRTIFSWIFALLLLVPMFSIAIRCLYVVFNKNAYQSYADYQQETSIQITNRANFEIGSEYIINYKDGTSVQSPRFLYSKINLDPNAIFQNNKNYIGFAILDNNSLRFYADDTSYNNTSANSWSSTYTSITFTYNGMQNEGNWNTGSAYIVYSRFFVNGTLDNVFEYSVQQFVDKHGNGLINFFGLLEQYFMQSTSANALYFTFANWCLNYVLLVSCVWLLFSVLMWFINYCNYMLNTSFRKGHGD